MAKNEDGTLASHPLRDENHFPDKEDIDEVDRNRHPSDFKVSWDSIYCVRNSSEDRRWHVMR